MSLMGILDRVADSATLDKAIEPARRAVQAALRPQALRDLLHGTWLGHPLHPVLVQVPVGSWTSAGLLDAIPPLRPAATVLIGTGVAVAVPAALSGAADWSEQGIGVRRLGLLHAAGNTVALGLYIGSLVARAQGRGGLGRVLSYAGLGIASGSAAVGGHMSYAQSSGASHAATAARALSSDWIDLGPLDDLPEVRRPTRRTSSRSACRPAGSWPGCPAATGRGPARRRRPYPAGRAADGGAGSRAGVRRLRRDGRCGRGGSPGVGVPGARPPAR